MQFNAPEIVSGIRDISEIYRVNDIQEIRLDAEIGQLEDDIMISSSGEEKLKRYEKLLGINPKDTESLEDRRLSVKSRLDGNTSYGVDGIVKSLEALCGGKKFNLVEDYTEEHVHLQISLEAKKRYSSAMEILEQMLPLNIFLTGEILYHTYGILKAYTYEDLAAYECGAIREI